MTKTELTAEVAKKVGLTKKDAALAVNAVFDCVKEALVKGEKVQLVGFGSFDEIAASLSPKFTAGAALKEAVK